MKQFWLLQNTANNEMHRVSNITGNITTISIIDVICYMNNSHMNTLDMIQFRIQFLQFNLQYLKLNSFFKIVYCTGPYSILK